MSNKSDKPDKPKKKYPIKPLTPEMIDLRDKLLAKREELGLTDQAFHRKYLHGSYTTWYRWSTNQYNGDIDKQFEIYKKNFAQLIDIKALNPLLDSSEPFYEFPVFEAIVNAIKKALDTKDENRLVIFLAKEGGGKDALCRQLKKIFNADILEATESWRKSYTAGCADVCQCIKVKGTWKSTRETEKQMLLALNKNRHILVINEGNSFGPHTLNMIKLILNQTNSVVAIFAIPGIFDRMKHKSWFESSQVIRRAVAVIEAPDIEPDHVAPFLAEFNMNGSREPACMAIAAAANSFGRYNMIKRIVQILRDKKYNANSREVPLSAVESSIAEAEAFLRLYL
jgi:hypothetical protein